MMGIVFGLLSRNGLLLAGVGVGIAALLVWDYQRMERVREQERIEIKQKSKKAAAKRHAKINRQRASTPVSGAWKRLLERYPDSN